MFSRLFCKHEYTLSRFENRFIDDTRSFGITGVETHKCIKCGHEMEKQVRAKFPRQAPPLLPRKEENKC